MMQFGYTIGITVIICIALSKSEHNQLPSFPLQFEATVEVTAHLVDKTKDYPPWLRKIRFFYDFPEKIARADILQGLDAGKTYIRNYQEKQEYMIKYGEFQDCQRAYLGETMPLPEFPNDMQLLGEKIVHHIPCQHWMHESFNTRIHVFCSIRDNVPIQLIEEQKQGKEYQQMLTYDFSKIKVGSQDKAKFTIPGGYVHDTCTRNFGGFPYLHLFHYYLRF